MKETGIVRRIDPLGRIVLPKELRKVLNIEEGDPIEIFTDGNMVVLSKYEVRCCHCGRTRMDATLKEYEGKLICEHCAKSIAKSFGLQS